MTNPFNQAEMILLRQMNREIDVIEKEPKISKIIENMHSYEWKKPRPRDLATITRHAFSGFGGEHAFCESIPGAIQLNPGVTDVTGVPYPQLMRDVMFNSRYFAVKVWDRTDHKSQFWISPGQRNSIANSAPFCEFLIVLGFLRTSTFKFQYDARYLIDIKPFSENFDGYAKKTAKSIGYEFHAETAIRRGICIDLQDNSL